MSRTGNRRSWLFALLTAAGIWALAEGGSWLALALVGESPADETNVEALSRRHREILAGVLEGRASHIELSPTLGWTASPGAASGDYRINAHGLRSDVERSPGRRSGGPRIASFGDSFTFGAGVNVLLTFQETLMRLRPDLEVLNFGVPGYGLDQAYLRYSGEGRAWTPDIVLIGFMTENVNRVVNTFRPFYRPQTGLPFGKPRFLLASDGLELLPNPLPGAEAYRELLERPRAVLARLAEHDAYAPWRPRRGLFERLPSVRLVQRAVRREPDAPAPESEAAVSSGAGESYEVARRLFDRFYTEVEAAGSHAVIVIFPRQQDIGLRRRGEPSPNLPLIEHFEAKGYRYLDLLALFDGVPEPPKELADPHLTARAHHYVAVGILSFLEQQHLVQASDETAPAAARRELVRTLERSPSFAELDAGSRRTILAQAESGRVAAH